MGKIKRAPTDQSVSPYLKRPLRSLAHVLANRTATEGTAARANQDSLRAEAQQPPSVSEGAPSAPD